MTDDNITTAGRGDLAYSTFFWSFVALFLTGAGLGLMMLGQATMKGCWMATILGTVRNFRR